MNWRDWDKGGNILRFGWSGKEYHYNISVLFPVYGRGRGPWSPLPLSEDLVSRLFEVAPYRTDSERESSDRRR